MPWIRLGDFCQARSGDKADVANVAVFAPDDATYVLLRQQLTAERVARHLAPLVEGRVVRYEAPNVLALNFVCERALGGGGTRTLRSDMLGKTLGPNVLRLRVDVPEHLVRRLRILRPPLEPGGRTSQGMASLHDAPWVLIVTGPPGAGKSTVASRVAQRFETATCIESDWFWTTIVKGYVEPWEPDADAQNRAVLRSFAAAAVPLAVAGYAVVVDGIVGPWYLDIVTDEVRRGGVAAHYVVLRPSIEVALQRATARAGEPPRVPGRSALTDETPVGHMWRAFSELGDYERHVIDTSAMSVEETVDLVWERFSNGTHRL